MIFKELFLGSYSWGVMRRSYDKPLPLLPMDILRWGVMMGSYDKPLPLLPMDIWPLITPHHNSPS